MLESITLICLAIADPILGWMLLLPRDVTLFLIALCTALLLMSIRCFTTDQDMLRRCKEDKARLRELIRKAKMLKDKDALLRYRATMAQIASRTFFAEGKPLLASVFPIAIIATWAFFRISYLPLSEAKEITLKVYTPISAVGQLAHILPQKGVLAVNGWIQDIREDMPSFDSATGDAAYAVNGVAEWKLKIDRQSAPYALKIRMKGKTFDRQLIVDGLRYAEPILPYGEAPFELVETVLSQYRPLGVLPGYGDWFPPWIIGYLIIVLPLAFILKPLLRIY